MYRSQRLGLKYLTASTVMFGAMVAFGVLSSIYYIWPGFLLNVFNFNTAKIIHIDGLVIWLLMGFLGAIYWFLPQELEREVEGIALAEILFWVFCAAVAVVVVVFLFVQYGSATESSMWFINQGRKYVEAPRWAALGIVAVMGVFAYNVIGTAVKARKSTGILTVLMFDLVPLVVLYLDAFPEIRNMSQDLFWWWWLVHLWVEATWEVLIGCIMAWTLIHLVGASRRVVESWLYVEVALVLGTGILGLGHHYFWIGTPRYWFAIGGFFSALEPLPLLGMVVHAVYDAGSSSFARRESSGLLLDAGRGLRKFHRRRRMGLHDDAAANQPLFAWHPMDRLARAFRILGRLRMRRDRGALSRAARRAVAMRVSTAAPGNGHSHCSTSGCSAWSARCWWRAWIRLSMSARSAARPGTRSSRCRGGRGSSRACGRASPSGSCSPAAMRSWCTTCSPRDGARPPSANRWRRRDHDARPDARHRAAARRASSPPRARTVCSTARRRSRITRCCERAAI